MIVDWSSDKRLWTVHIPPRPQLGFLMAAGSTFNHGRRSPIQNEVLTRLQCDLRVHRYDHPLSFDRQPELFGTTST